MSVYKDLDVGKLEYRTYKLGDNPLGRPPESTETVFVWGSSYMGVTTNPRASWYLGEDQMRMLFDGINTVSDFEVVRRALAIIRTEDDAKRFIKSRFGNTSQEDLSEKIRPYDSKLTLVEP